VEFLQTIKNQVRSRWDGLPEDRRTPMLVTTALTLCVVILVGSWLTRPRWVPLDKQPTDPADRSALLEQIEAGGWKVQIDSADRFTVLAEDKRRIQTELGVVINKDTPMGIMEALDKGGFGGTRAQEHARIVQGRQGEIEKLLNSYESVVGSKVMLSLQRDALFEEDRQAPRASVYLKLKSGVELSTREGEQMARQVANAVVGLELERVHILDEHMRTLHATSAANGTGGNALAEQQREWEGYYQRKVETLLSQMLGHGRATVSIGVQLDHAQRSVVARDLDPEKVVTISSKATEQTSEGAGAARGVAGTASNIDGALDSEAGPSTSASTEAVNIDVPETRKTDVKAPGEVLAITASVVVDGHRVAKAPAEGAEAETETAGAETVYQARTPEELEALTALVRNALGPAATKVEVQSHEFRVLDLEPTAEPIIQQLARENAGGLARYSAAFLLLLFAYGLVLRPMVQSVTRIDPPGGDDETVDALTIDDPQLPSPENAEPEFDVQGWLDKFSSGDQFVSRADVSRLVLADVAHSVVTLQEWLTEGDEA